MQTTCCWPHCDYPSESAIMPLCSTHAVEVYHFVKDGLDWRDSLSTAQKKRDVDRLKKTMAINERRAAGRLERGVQPGWIYYIRVGEHIKIGYSADVPQRLRGYPPDSKLLAVHPGTPDLERQIHRDLATSRAWGREWYRPDLAVMDRVDQAVAQFGPPQPFKIKVRNTGQAMKPKSWR